MSKYCLRSDAGFANQGHGLSDRFDDRSDQEVAAELHEIASLRCLGDDEGFLPDRIEERRRSFDRIWRTGGNDEELTRGRGIWAADHGRRHEKLSRFRVGRLKPLR
jgi:hypothetical protein